MIKSLQSHQGLPPLSDAWQESIYP